MSEKHRKAKVVVHRGQDDTFVMELWEGDVIWWVVSNVESPPLPGRATATFRDSQGNLFDEVDIEYTEDLNPAQEPL